jgi:hypothetical protein
MLIAIMRCQHIARISFSLPLRHSFFNVYKYRRLYCKNQPKTAGYDDECTDTQSIS